MTHDKAILIVDDEAILLMALKRALKMKFGDEYLYEVALSANLGLEAIDRLVKEGVTIVLVISDWLMPGMKGDEFLSIVRSRSPETRLIMLSGHLDDDEMQRIREDVGLRAFIRKPWNLEQLLKTIREALD